ncbi:YtxH domain-containing protein [Vibrio harveyi]|uniref:YtxH domain-containing protein n=1 Tax=Vibrio harveyi TaxID=669 RepID=UPI00211A6731|nr:YtxH domain-containing protein [Vibrio harveyi]MCQ9076722.1 hypothetical protein [Vibrio harveyi]
MSIELTTILTFLIGGLSGALVSYLNQKGKNRALIEDNRRLEEEKQEVSHEYNKKIELVKKEFSLEVERKKYHYQAKYDQYIKFFGSLDDYTKETNDLLRKEVPEKFGRFIIEFATSDMAGDSNATMKAVSDFCKFNQNMMAEITRGFQSLKQETNAINLVCSDETRKQLIQLEKAIEKANQSSFGYLEELCTPEGFHDSDSLDPKLQEAQEDAQVIEIARQSVIDSMRDELKQI